MGGDHFVVCVPFGRERNVVPTTERNMRSGIPNDVPLR
jgi:hypothetical protein